MPAKYLARPCGCHCSPPLDRPGIAMAWWLEVPEQRGQRVGRGPVEPPPVPAPGNHCAGNETRQRSFRPHRSWRERRIGTLTKEPAQCGKPNRHARQLEAPPSSVSGHVDRVSRGPRGPRWLQRREHPHERIVHLNKPHNQRAARPAMKYTARKRLAYARQGAPRIGRALFGADGYKIASRNIEVKSGRISHC